MASWDVCPTELWRGLAANVTSVHRRRRTGELDRGPAITVHTIELMSAQEPSPSQPCLVALSGVGTTGSVGVAPLSTAPVTGIFGMRDTVRFIAIPEHHPNDQQRRQPLERSEAFSTAPALLGLGGYMLARRAFRVIRNLDQRAATRRTE